MSTDLEEPEAKELACPHCGKEISPASYVPEEQTMVMTLKSESPFFDCGGLGDMLKALAKSMRSIADSHDENVAVFVTGIKVVPHTIDVQVTIVAQKRKAEENGDSN